MEERENNKQGGKRSPGGKRERGREKKKKGRGSGGR